MHLERVSARSSEAGLAGWIASNDATLFTMVLIVAVAIFLHSRLSATARQQSQTAGEKAALELKLASVASELDSAGDLLDKSNKQLALTQSERDQLEQQLVERLNELTQLTARLDAATKQTTALEAERQALVDEKQSLEERSTKLLVTQSQLTKDRKALTASNTTLRERLESLSTELERKVAALEEAERERDRLKKQADELDAIVGGLKQRLKELDLKLDQTKQSAAAEALKLQEQADELRSQAAKGDKQVDEYLARLKRATELFEGLKAENVKLKGALSEADDRRRSELLEQGRNDRELVGLKGEMQRVAILIDASGSMRQQGNGGRDRWQEALKIVASWLTHLNMGECVLIVFSTHAQAFPSDGSLVDLRGEAGKANRERLLQHLRSVSPGGWTDTLEALQKAYQYKVDTILIFSDGAPSKVDTGVFDPALASQIFGLCQRHKGIPINAVGLGNYFDQEMANFLRNLAGITGGSFRGQ
jgi:uncharacterized coiled-coil DUF342 family protein